MQLLWILKASYLGVQSLWIISSWVKPVRYWHLKMFELSVHLFSSRVYQRPLFIILSNIYRQNCNLVCRYCQIIRFMRSWTDNFIWKTVGKYFLQMLVRSYLSPREMCALSDDILFYTFISVLHFNSVLVTWLLLTAFPKQLVIKL